MISKIAFKNLKISKAWKNWLTKFGIDENLQNYKASTTYATIGGLYIQITKSEGTKGV